MRIEALMLQIWYNFNYEGYLNILGRLAGNKCVLWTFMDAFGSFLKFLRRIFKADSYVACDRIRIRNTTNCLTFTKNNIYCYQFDFGTRNVQAMQKDFQ